ncbi:MAG: VWA domain-containing protein, partial [Candidatus Omnitrophota bacterium]
MRFAGIQAAYLFWFIIALAGFFFWANARRRKALETFADKNLLAGLVASFDIRKYRLKQVLVIVSFSLMVFALMRPQWGFKWQEIKRKGLDILVAVDVSKSMLAEDIKPNRLERTKLALADFVKHLKGDRIGLIAFSGSAFVQCPLTNDYSGFLLSAESLDIDTIPKGGTYISSAIRQAIESYEGGIKKYKVLIIITDGEDHEGDPVDAAELAEKEGIKIFCIGIGTNEGELIPITEESG